MIRLFRLLLLVAVIVVLGAGSAHADRVADLSRALTSDSNWKVRMQAANVLGRLHDPRAVPALLRALSDASETVRAVSAAALGQIGDGSAVPALQRALRDPSALVHDQAQLALESLDAASQQKSAGEHHGGARVEIGAITSRTSRLPGDLADRLRQAVTRALQQTPGATLASSGGSYVLDTAVTRLTRRVSRDSVEIECEISLILGRLPGKAIVLTTSGDATSKGPLQGRTPVTDHALIVDALDGAVTGAWANLNAFFDKISARR